MRFQNGDCQDKRIDTEKDPLATVIHFAQVQLLIQVMDKLRFVDGKNKIDDQPSGVDTQTNKNDPGYNEQAFKYDITS